MVKIVNARVLATTVCQLVNNSLSTLCTSCVCLRVCASCQTPRRHGPAQKSGAMWRLSDCHALHCFGILHKLLTKGKRIYRIFPVIPTVESAKIGSFAAGLGPEFALVRA